MSKNGLIDLFVIGLKYGLISAVIGLIMFIPYKIIATLLPNLSLAQQVIVLLAVLILATLITGFAVVTATKKWR